MHSDWVDVFYYPIALGSEKVVDLNVLLIFVHGMQWESWYCWTEGTVVFLLFLKHLRYPTTPCCSSIHCLAKNTGGLPEKLEIHTAGKWQELKGERVILGLSSGWVISGESSPRIRMRVREWQSEIVVIAGVWRFSKETLLLASGFSLLLCLSKISMTALGQWVEEMVFLLGLWPSTGRLLHEVDLPSWTEGSESHWLLACSGSYKWKLRVQRAHNFTLIDI